MKVELHPCFILHSMAYRETSLIMEVFSLQYGRVSVIAKGAKGRKNNRVALLQPARKLNLSWSGRGEMGTMTGVETHGSAYSLKGKNILSVFYINEILVRMLHKHEPHQELFEAYDHALSQLSQGKNEEQVLRMFEKDLLDSLGYGLLLQHEARTGELINSDEIYYYNSEHGPNSHKQESVETIKISGKTLLSLHNNGKPWDDDVSREAKELLRSILNRHMENRPLQSRELYKAYLQTQAPIN